jgi:hypothetical protein
VRQDTSSIKSDPIESRMGKFVDIIPRQLEVRSIINIAYLLSKEIIKISLLDDLRQLRAIAKSIR